MHFSKLSLRGAFLFDNKLEIFITSKEKHSPLRHQVQIFVCKKPYGDKVENAFAYAKSRSPEQIDCDKTFKELCCEWLDSAKLRVKHSSYCCYEKLINKHIIPYFEDVSYD